MNRFFLLFALIAVSLPLLAVVERNDAPPEYIAEYYQKALDSYQQRNYDQSLDHIRHVIKSDMTNYRLRMLAAHNHWRLGNYVPAEQHFRTAIASDNLQPGAYIDLSLFYLQRGDLRKSLRTALSGKKTLEEANRPVPARLYNVLARVSLLLSRPQDALEYATSAKAAYEKNQIGVKDQLEAIILEGRAHMLMGKYEEAELSISWGLDIRPDSAYIENLLGFLYETWATKATDTKKAQLRSQAAERYRKVLARNDLPPDFRAIVESNLKRVSP